MSETARDALEDERNRVAVSAVSVWHHRDPFDRLLVAQALTEGLELVTADPRFAAYGGPVVW